MVVRRIREHVSSHNWFAVAIDLAIVVAGVFIGMQANNWNEARIDRQKGQSYRDRLIEELRSTESSMRGTRVYYEDVRVHALKALSSIENQGAEAGEAFLIDSYQATQLFPRFAKHTTYDELISSGRAELLGSPDLRDRVSNFYWRMDGLVNLSNSVTPYRDRMRTLMPYAIQKRIQERCPDLMINDGKGLITSRLPQDCEAGIEPNMIDLAVRRIRDDQSLSGYLNRALIDLDLKVLNFGKLERGARELRHHLEALDRTRG